MQKLRIGFLFMLILAVGTNVLFTTTAQASEDNRSEQAELKARSRLARQGVDVDQLKAKDIITDETGNHVRFSQYLNGIRIYGQEIITHEKNNGKFAQTTGNLINADANFISPYFNEETAISIAEQYFGLDGESDVELVYYPRESQLVLAYLIDIRNTDKETNEPRREMIVVDAQTGMVIDRWNNLQTAGTLGTGKGYYAGTVSNFPIDLTSGTYTMFDVPNNGKTYDFNNRTCNIFGCGTNVGTIYSSSTSTFGTDGSLGNRASIGVDAHYFSQKTLEYVYNTYGRRGIDNNNNASLRMGFMVSRTHYGKSYNNAYWDGASMTYGDGDGTTYRPFDAIDVVGHEMTHGITERTSNLRYQNESGAANESFSDIIGVAVEFYTGQLTGFGGQLYPSDWWIGEDLYKTSNPASPSRGIRHMADPHIEGDPCHYSEKINTTSDNGGVHTNSGIQNKVYYLLSAGGTNHKDTTGTVVTGIGWSDAAKVAFDADTKFCTIDDTYAKVANAWVNAAKNRFGAGSAAAQQAYNAWKACGVTPTVAP